MTQPSSPVKPQPKAESPWLEPFTRWLLLEKGLSANSVKSYCSDLSPFFSFLQHQRLSVELLSAADASDFRQWLHQRGYQASTLARKLSALRQFYRFLLIKKIVKENPFALQRTPKTTRHLPKPLNENDIEALLQAPDTRTLTGLRDKAMLEVMYAAGLRVSELVNLRLGQVNLNRGLLRIFGKGEKERLVPLGEEAVTWLSRYLHARAISDSQNHPRQLIFSTLRGSGMTRQAFWYRIKKYARQCGLSPLPSPHQLRHSFATHLLNHGADLRVVQMLLGHENLSTTQIYTQVANRALKTIHRKHHPRG